MQKEEFIREINRTITEIDLKDEYIEYAYSDTSNFPELYGNTVAAVGPLTADVTIRYKGKTKTYKAEHGTTFPCEFISDYQNGYYAEQK